MALESGSSSEQRVSERLTHPSTFPQGLRTLKTPRQGLQQGEGSYGKLRGERQRAHGAHGHVDSWGRAPALELWPGCVHAARAAAPAHPAERSGAAGSAAR